MSGAEGQKKVEAVEDTASTVPTKKEEQSRIKAEPDSEPPRKSNQNAEIHAATLPSLNNSDLDAEGDSEAETLIQSPEKKRAVVDDRLSLPLSGHNDISDTGSLIEAAVSDKENSTRKRKRSLQDSHIDPISENISRRSSPLSSPIGQSHSDDDSDRSVRPTRRKAESPQPHRNGKRDVSSTQDPRAGSPHKRRRRPSEVVPTGQSHKRSKRNSVDSTDQRETRAATYPQPSSDEKSPSPASTTRGEYQHRRGASTQLTTHDFERKRRGRPPLINTRRNRSVDRASLSSEGSESTRRARPPLHKFSSHDQDIMSPAKVGPRKWRDKNGRTYLARACANQDLEGVRAKYSERPEDINLPDNAGNTPLQIAALEGYVNIVRFLLEKGADVHARNIDKDTPLIDAVENGHVEVIRLLLNYGANPRQCNARGDDLYELVDTNDENYDEIRRLLADARDKDSKKNRLSDQNETAVRDGNSSRAASVAAPSPRDSPPAGQRSPPTLHSRRRTGRSESTRNDLLWQAHTQENLAKLAAKGDTQGVASILSILERADTEALIAAAKAGHEDVLQLLIAMGAPDPDPQPVRSSTLKPGYNTPMLAAIGRGHPDVVKLLASHGDFNPTRKYREKTYYELAQERRGDRWEQEYSILKQAYDRYTSSKGRKNSSPRKTRDPDKYSMRASPRSSSPITVKRTSPGPLLLHKSLSSKSGDSMVRDKRKVSDPGVEKRRPLPRQDIADNSLAVSSDLDQNTNEKKTHRTRRSKSDLPPVMDEPTYKRRRLVTGREHRNRQNLTASSGSESDSVIQVKREEPFSHPTKRTRTSRSPDHTNGEADQQRMPNKKRRTMLESSPEEVKPRIVYSVVPPTDEKKEKAVRLAHDDESEPRNQDDLQKQTDGNASPRGARPSSGPDLQVAINENNISHTTSNNGLGSVDLSASTSGTSENATSRWHTTSGEADVNFSAPEQAEWERTEAREKELKEEEERKAKEVREKQAAEAKAAQEAKEVEERQKREAKEAEEAEQAKKAEQAAMEAAAAAAAAAAAEAEAEAKAEARRREEERKAREMREAEEAEARRIADEEEQARRKAEDERQEQLRKELEERRRLEHLEQLEQERRRLEALPNTLRKTAQMLDQEDPAVRSPDWLKKYLPLFTVKTRQLQPDCNLDTAEEEWIANFQAAGLLSTKDLGLSEYGLLEKRVVSEHEQQCLWRVARLKLSYDYNATWNTSVKQSIEIEEATRIKFFAMDSLFWVKLSGFFDQIPSHPHLAGIDLRKQPISLKTYDQILNGSRSPSNSTNSPRAWSNGVPGEGQNGYLAGGVSR